jgi:hypothetical protein
MMKMRKDADLQQGSVGLGLKGLIYISSSVESPGELKLTKMSSTRA